MELSLEVVLVLLEELPEGIAVLDARRDALPIVFANRAFAALCGRPAGQLLDLPLADLIEEARGPGRLGELRALLTRGEGVTWRVGAAAGGTDSAADVRFQPLRTRAEDVTHYLSVQWPVAAPAVAPAPAAAPRTAESSPPVAALAPPAAGETAAAPASELRPLPRDDRLTGLAHAEYFHELYRRDFAIAQREGRALTVFLVDIDGLDAYNTTFGRQAGDSAIRRVGRGVLSGMRRASDLVARVEGGRFIGLSSGLPAEQARRHGETLAARVRELHMHHPRSPVARFVTVSVGVAQCVPSPQAAPEALLEAAQQALDDARAAGRNGVALRSLDAAAGTGFTPG